MVVASTLHPLGLLELLCGSSPRDGSIHTMRYGLTRCNVTAVAKSSKNNDGQVSKHAGV